MHEGASLSSELTGLFVLADDGPRWPHDPVEQARAACVGGASVVQLRAKHATDRQILAWAREIRALTRDAGIGFFVNDRFDLALLADADGVHLGQNDLAPERLPTQARARLQVGRSTHDEAQLTRARTEPIDYIAYGPVFDTASKESPYTARGLEALGKAAASATPTPLVAIGGIGVAEAAAVAAAGAAGFAVISAVAGARDPLEATRRLVEAFRTARPEHVH